jgi:hypothetical protein
MPRLPTECSKYIMYKLCCLDPNITDEYVGSTTNFKNRKSRHKKNCNNPNSKEYNFNVYQTIRENGGWENWNMIQIEEYPCNNKREAKSREEFWRKELKATLNMIKAFTTKEEKIEQHKKWIEQNKNKILKKQKEYTENNKEKIKKYQREYMKIYRLKKKQDLENKVNN